MGSGVSLCLEDNVTPAKYLDESSSHEDDLLNTVNNDTLKKSPSTGTDNSKNNTSSDPNNSVTLFNNNIKQPNIRAVPNKTSLKRQSKYDTSNNINNITSNNNIKEVQIISNNNDITYFNEPTDFDEQNPATKNSLQHRRNTTTNTVVNFTTYNTNNEITDYNPLTRQSSKDNIVNTRNNSIVAIDDSVNIKHHRHQTQINVDPYEAKKKGKNSLAPNNNTHSRSKSTAVSKGNAIFQFFSKLVSGNKSTPLTPTDVSLRGEDDDEVDDDKQNQDHYNLANNNYISSHDVSPGSNTPTNNCSPKPLTSILRSKPNAVIDTSTGSNIRKFADIKSTILSNCMNDNELEQFSNLFTVYKFQAHQTIYMQNTLADYFYIIRSGELLVQVDKKQYTVARAKSKANLMKKMSSKTLAATIEELEQEDQEQLNHINKINNKIIHQHHSSINHPNINNSNNISNYNKLGLNHRRSSSGGLSIDSSNSAVLNLAVKTCGEFIGFDTLISPNSKYICTVISLSDCTCLGISRSNYETFIQQNPSIHDRIIQVCSTYMHESLAKNSLFRSLSHSKLILFSSLFKHNYISSNTIIFNEGEKTTDHSCFYFIYSGSCNVTWTDDKNKIQNKVLTSGSTFGELSLLLDLDRTASVSTIEDCILFELTRSSLRYFLYLEPSLMKYVKEKIEDANINMKYLINNPIIQHHFALFCEREHSVENLNFYIAAQEFHINMKQYVNNGQDIVIKQAKQIINMYIDNNSDTVINISSGCRKRIMDAIDENEEFPHQYPLNENLFIEAEMEIFALMKSDSFSRFKQNNLFKQAIEKLNAVDIKSNNPLSPKRNSRKFNNNPINNNNNHNNRNIHVSPNRLTESISIPMGPTSPSNRRHSSIASRSRTNTSHNHNHIYNLGNSTTNLHNRSVNNNNHNNNNNSADHTRTSSRETVVQFLKQRQLSSRNLLAAEAKSQQSQQAAIQAEKLRILAANAPVNQVHAVLQANNVNNSSDRLKKLNSRHNRSNSTIEINSQHFQAHPDIPPSIPGLILSSRQSVSNSALRHIRNRSLDLTDLD